MGLELGRVSGSLLSSNLLRNGEDLAFETDLLYLDLTNNRVGIHKSSPANQLHISGTSRTTNLNIDTEADLASLIFTTNQIQNLTGSIIISPNQASNPTTVIPNVKVSNLNIFNNQLIQNLVSNDNINLSPITNGQVVLNTNTFLVNGDLHATGDITWDGNITIGDTNTDNVTFFSEVSSNIIPDGNNTRNLGSSSQYWNILYSVNTSATSITSTTSITANNINLLLAQGKTYYVSVNGSDTNYGNHQHSPYKSIKKALSVATSGDEIIIYSGTYQEIFPMTVPAGVSVKGSSINATIINPTSGTNNKDAFLLNGDTTISFLTISNFFYDSVNNTGYAFRFASGYNITLKSPYIFNVSVKTYGSVTSGSDPLGFNQGDAGGGAYIDGSVASVSISKIPSMLFYDVSFSTPNQNCITALNGVRVEWLNSITYYAKRGVYLTRGTLGASGLGISYGSEVRCINSNNFYGTNGVVADGNNTTAYLTNHTFSYIGSGSSSINDPSTVNQANEVVPINGGVIIYESMDQLGNYRIGDIFYVNQDTGQVTFNAQSISFTAGGSIVLENNNGYTYIDAYAVQNNNIVIHDNNIDSLFGPVNLLASSGTTTLATNVTVTGTSIITGNTLIKGNTTVGNSSTDTVLFNTYLTQTIKPNATSTYTLGYNNGTTSSYWRTAYLRLVDVNGVIQLTNNGITTLTTNTDLRLVANGNGGIHALSSPVEITNNLTINGSTYTKNIVINGNINQTGDVILTGDINRTGDTGITGTYANNNIIVYGSSSYVSASNVKLQNNVISTTNTNGDLTLLANGTGGVIFDQRTKITDNIISNNWIGATTDTQKSIILSPNGTGNVVVNSTKAVVLPNGNDSNRILSTLGEIRYNNISNMVEAWQPSGYVNFANLWDSDRNTYITAELTPGANDNKLRFGINGSVIATIDPTSLTTNNVLIDNVSIIDNTISNSNNSLNIVLTPTGTGIININNIFVKDNSISNQTNNALHLVSTNDGYVMFDGTNGIVLPNGNNAARPLSPETGETRFNTELGILEVYNGTIWISSIGSSGYASSTEVSDTISYWALMVG